MTRHPVDWLSLVFGVIAVAIAVASLADLSLVGLIADLGPVVLLLAGGFLLVGAARSARPDRGAGAADTDA